MPRITIDQHTVDVPAESTILEAAEYAGVEIPTLCFLKGFDPSTSCLVCMVKLRDPPRLVPACATRVVDGMRVDSETDEVHDVRRAALELLLSDHVGDCLAPCYFGCPARMDIPLMLRQIEAGAFSDAIITIKRDIALPAVLGRICPKPCEKTCRRAAGDGPVAICQLKRQVADWDLEQQHSYVPECRPETGKSVAVVGAGPTGLAASYQLRRLGHRVVLFDRNPKPGGRLRQETTEAELPRDVLDAEVDALLAISIESRQGEGIEGERAIDELLAEHDAVLIACGRIDRPVVEAWGVGATDRGISVRGSTYRSNRDGVFAAGNATRGKSGMVIRSVADGKEAAEAIDAWLTDGEVMERPREFSVRMGRVVGEELVTFMDTANPAEATDAGGQAGRCLRCDCRALTTCRLKRYAEQYGADVGRFRGQRARFLRDNRHASVLYEPGKCIDCGLCIEIARRADEPLGLTFIGRGFDVRIGAPFDHTISEALVHAAEECVAACPTAALVMREGEEDAT